MEEIDINKLKQDLKDYYEAAYFTLGYGAVLMDSFDLNNLSDEEIISKAAENSVDLEQYIINNSNKKLSR
ncbi:MAG: hypothetical protein MR765_00390 [Tenericutes bacterium]|nr:hypothetical protein [Mycoplasmatota bacterium]